MNEKTSKPKGKNPYNIRDIVLGLLFGASLAYLVWRVGAYFGLS